MGLFKKKTVQEQIDLESLLPDKETVTRLKKQLTSVQTARSKMDSRLAEIEAEVKAAIELEATFTTEGKGYEGAFSAITDFLKKKKEQPDPELLAEEIKHLNAWWSQYSVPVLTEVQNELRTIYRQQQDNVIMIEETFETASNTVEIDEVHSLLTADYNALLGQLRNLAQIKDATTDKVTFYTGLEQIRRNSISTKAAGRAEKERSNALHAARAQDAVNQQLISEGKAPVPNPWTQPWGV